VTVSSPREAAYELLSGGMFPWSSRPVSVRRGRITLRKRDETGPRRKPEVEHDEVMMEGPSFTIDLATIRFLKQREVHGRHLFAVSFDATMNPILGGRRHEMGLLIAAFRTGAGGWQARRGCGLRVGTKPPPFDLPYVALGTHWNRDEGFYGAASLYPGEAHVTAIRLRFPDNSSAEADTEDNVALFYVEQPRADMPPVAPFNPQTIEIVDGDKIIATQAARQPPPRPPAPQPPPLSA
jgi:hypothetical protein